jgi:hypothetical protein
LYVGIFCQLLPRWKVHPDLSTSRQSAGISTEDEPSNNQQQHKKIGSCSWGAVVVVYCSSSLLAIHFDTQITMTMDAAWPQSEMEELVALLKKEEDGAHYRGTNGASNGVGIAQAWRHKICDW